MKLHILAVGRLKAGPNRTLIEAYQARLQAAPAQIGPLEITEIDDRKDLKRIHKACLEAIDEIANGPPIIALDEKGRDFSSREFSRKLADWRDAGAETALFIIGGADGLDDEIRARADLTLALGRQTWPHMLARVMLAEQLYRAASLLSGHPYHRD